MQKGSIYKHGSWWILAYREKVIEGGVEKSVKRYKNLARIDHAHRTEASVRDLAGKITGKLAGARAKSVDTLERYLVDTFLPWVKRDLKPSTAESYDCMLALVRTSPWILEKRLDEINTSDVRQLLTEIAARPALGGKPRSQSSINNARNFLSGAFKEACNLGLLNANPCRDLKTPKGARPAETHAYSVAEVQAMIAAVAGDEIAKTVILVAALTGLRKSEIQGLKWEDFDGEVLHVRREWWNGLELSTKTEGSKADVPLLPILAEALAEHKSRNGINSWCFHGSTGQPINLQNFERANISPKLEAAGLRWYGWHAFRRGVATNLHELGAPDRLIQAIMRHSNLKTTMAHYVKARPESTAKEMAKLGEAFAAPAKKTRKSA